MKFTKYIFIVGLLFLIVAHGMTPLQICMGSAHCHASADWATNCHADTNDTHDAKTTSFSHQESRCIDVSISSVFGSAHGIPCDDFQYVKTSAVIKSSDAEHSFYSSDSAKRTPSLLPDFIDAGRLSIKSTILII